MCQAWTAIPLALWDISERQGRCYSEVVLFHFLGSNRTGFVETKCRFNFLIARRTWVVFKGVTANELIMLVNSCVVMLLEQLLVK